MYDYPFAVTYHTFAFISKYFQEKNVISLSMCEHKLNNALIKYMYFINFVIINIPLLYRLIFCYFWNQEKNPEIF